MCPHSLSHPHPQTYTYSYPVIANNHPLNVVKLYAGDGSARLLARTPAPAQCAWDLDMDLDSDSASHNHVYYMLSGNRVHANGLFVHREKKGNVIYY